MNSLLQIFYDGLWYPVAAGFCLFHCLGNGKDMAFRERLALYPPLGEKKNPRIWFHASSLGEVLTITPLMKKLRTRFLHDQVLSVSTVRGAKVAPKSGADHILYLPLDLSPLVKKAFRKIAPDMVIVLETEIWPSLFWQCARKNIPLLIISGRISPRSFPRYKLIRFLLADILKHPLFLMQSEEDSQRIVALGAPKDRVEICGNIKFDGLSKEMSVADIDWLKKTFVCGSPLIVAGSTHPGEEEILLNAWQQLGKKYHGLSLILAPRHMERLAEVETLLKERHIDYRLRSQMPDTIKTHVTLVDTYGELARIYWLADIAFVGGTLTPVGGHNLMEPAALGKPLIIGPHFSTCRRQVQMFTASNAIIVSKTPREFVENLEKMLSNPKKAGEMGKRAHRVILDNQGSLQRCVDKIEKICISAQ